MTRVFLLAEEYDKLNGKIAEEAERNERINIAVEQKYKELENVEKKLEARDRENLQLKADIIRFWLFFFAILLIRFYGPRILFLIIVD